MGEVGPAKRILYSAIGLSLILAVVHSSVWYVVTSRIEAAVPAFVSAAAEQGWTVESQAPERAGWPWMPSVRLPNMVATRSLGDTTLRWTAGRVDLTIPFFDLQTLWVVPTGNQTVEFPGWERLQLRAGLARLRVPLVERRPAVLEIHDLTIKAATTELQARHVQAEMAALAAFVTADGVEVRPALPAPFNVPGDASVRATSTVSPGVGPAAWGSASGRVDLPAFSAQWGPLSVAGDGSGGLDGLLQPEGRATLRVKGGMELLDALARGGIIAAGPASAARAVLGLLTLAAHGQAVPLPVALADRIVTVAQFPIIRVPLVTW